MIKVEAWEAEDGSLYSLEEKDECERFEDRLKTYELRQMLEAKDIDGFAIDIIVRDREIVFNALSQFFVEE